MKGMNIMIKSETMKRLATLSCSAFAAAVMVMPSVVFAVSPAAANASTSQPATSTQSTTEQANQATRLANIIKRGDAEIARRLVSLNTLISKVNESPHLSSSDKTSLIAAVNTEISGLSALKTKLDADTTVAAAVTDAQSIITDYRVYALLLPKVWIVKTADDQIAVEAKLTALAAKLQTRITAAQTAGKDVTSLTSALADMNKLLTNSNSISTSVETAVLALQPSDYNANHAALKGYLTQLQTAHQDNQAAFQDAKTIIVGLK